MAFLLLNIALEWDGGGLNEIHAWMGVYIDCLHLLCSFAF